MGSKAQMASFQIQRRKFQFAKYGCQGARPLRAVDMQMVLEILPVNVAFPTVRSEVDLAKL